MARSLWRRTAAPAWRSCRRASRAAAAWRRRGTLPTRRAPTAPCSGMCAPAALQHQAAQVPRSLHVARIACASRLSGVGALCLCDCCFLCCGRAGSGLTPGSLCSHSVAGPRMHPTRRRGRSSTGSMPACACCASPAWLQRTGGGWQGCLASSWPQTLAARSQQPAVVRSCTCSGFASRGCLQWLMGGATSEFQGFVQVCAGCSAIE